MIALGVTLGLDPGQRALRLYHFYRLSVGLLLVLLISSNLDDRLLDLAHVRLFRFGSWTYLIINIVATLLIQRARGKQFFALALLDILLLGALFYAAGGMPSGLASLMIIAVAIANLLLNGRSGLLIAAVAALSTVLLTFQLSLSQPAASSQFIQAGALGALCFAVALTVQSLVRRLQISERLARQRADDVANLEALNSLILQRMRTGILVLDPQHQVLLANPAATQMLGQSAAGQPLADICPELLERLRQWSYNPTRRPQSLCLGEDARTLQPSFASLQHGQALNTLVFIEDISEITQHAQEMKLVSLGRLTAGIAHEIRNPLGAISHAAQLLLESEELPPPDRRLAQIVQDQSRRMNHVIENVLQLSRRRQAAPQLLDLKYWLHRFASEFRQSATSEQQLHLQTASGSIQTRFDPHQLTQILSNLVQNGLRYSARHNPQGQVWMRLYRDPDSDLPVLDVLDDGPGVGSDQQLHIFEPFFTTDSKGTGLGLYISRELCESNQAHLAYYPRPEGGSCFRITFAHPRKMSWTPTPSLNNKSQTSP
ncbi:sensor histidine kinase [Pseudomonas flexibilis]|uniref:histidine kinase n=1 Tax=Pseudomonas flexibilis TaxID=706570 RepID=A0A1N6VV72_9PSED|nr:ATP-binding protein [Pseudomonas flexibilis]KHL70548.1 histidine kinase [Pseudomonas flexibilis]SCY51065.1 two-component system, NtrC family, sensor histidine kinase PilS [Pseudomonas flexibilis]SIQ81694.1 Sensor protein PilS [Pseudomonas flexibilis]